MIYKNIIAINLLNTSNLTFFFHFLPKRSLSEWPSQTQRLPRSSATDWASGPVTQPRSRVSKSTTWSIIRSPT